MVLCLELRVERDGSIYGRYRVGSFKRGYGVSIAATLRRAMLSELPGIALTAVDIEGVAHEYCTMRGVRESVLDITCNLKEVVLSGHFPPSRGKRAFSGRLWSPFCARPDYGAWQGFKATGWPALRQPGAIHRNLDTRWGASNEGFDLGWKKLYPSYVGTE